MSGLNRNVMLAGMMVALAEPAVVGAGGIISPQARRDSTPMMSFVSDRSHRGKGRNKSPRRFTGVAAAKRAAIKARNKRAQR